MSTEKHELSLEYEGGGVDFAISRDYEGELCLEVVESRRVEATVSLDNLRELRDFLTAVIKKESQPKTPSEVVRETCPGCGKQVAIRKDGRFRHHHSNELAWPSTWRTRYCNSSNTIPKSGAE